MKKLALLFICLFTMLGVANADNDKPIQVTALPQTAQQFIKQHFADSNVALAKEESSFLMKSYEVIFTNGNKIEFDSKGNWEEVDCNLNALPSDIVPSAIRKYVATNYPEAKMLKIERDSKDYEVKLSNRVELKFDMKFNLIDIDN